MVVSTLVVVIAFDTYAFPVTVIVPPANTLPVTNTLFVEIELDTYAFPVTDAVNLPMSLVAVAVTVPATYTFVVTTFDTVTAFDT